MIKHAVLGTDFSKAVSRIIDHSEMFQTLGIQKLTLVHVLNLRDLVMIEKFSIEGLEEKLADQKRMLEEKGFETIAELIYGIPHLELEKKRKENGADIIILGAHGRTGADSGIGSTLADALQNLRAPVLAIPLIKDTSVAESFPGKNFYQYEHIMRQLETFEPECDLRSKLLVDHILLPTDFSDFSENAFQYIKDLSTSIPKITLLHIQDEVKIDKYLHDKLDEFNRIDTQRLNRLKDAFQASHPETVIDLQIQYGKPTQVILNYIKENAVSMAVMGSQGRGFFAEIFIGSVSLQVLRNAQSNVLIVPLRKG